MGYNRSGDIRKKRLKRAKKEAVRLLNKALGEAPKKEKPPAKS